MKIAFIGGRDIHTLGGIETYMYNLATELVKLGHQPIVFCEDNYSGQEIVNGFTVIHQKGPKSNLLCKPLLGLLSTLKVLIKYRDVDIIHYNAWPPSLWSPLANLFGKKSVMMGHGFEWRHTKYTPRQRYILKFMEKFTAHINSHLFMCSKEQCDYFLHNYHRKAELLPTATNLPAETYEKSDILNRYNIIPQKYFLFIGRLGKVKNVDVIIEAFNILNSNGYQLVIAGGSTGETEYCNKLYELAKDNQDIIFVGNVYNSDKDTLLRNAHAFCLVSTSEGMSISLLEAMSYKVPIISSDIRANRDVVEKDKAFWVRAENINDLVGAFKQSIETDILDRIMITEYNYELIREQYTWDKVAKKYVSLISKIVL